MGWRAPQVFALSVFLLLAPGHALGEYDCSIAWMGGIRVGMVDQNPFRADVILSRFDRQANGTWKETSVQPAIQIARDRAGRVALRFPSSWGPDKSIKDEPDSWRTQICDPVSETSTFIVEGTITSRIRDPASGQWKSMVTANGSATVAPLGLFQRLSAPQARFGRARWVDLPSRDIGGVVAQGYRYWPTGRASSQADEPNELWLSESLQCDVLSILSQDANVQRRAEITHLQLTEPDAAWFVVPNGFPVMNESRPR